LQRIKAELHAEFQGFAGTRLSAVLNFLHLTKLSAFVTVAQEAAAVQVTVTE